MTGQDQAATAAAEDGARTALTRAPGRRAVLHGAVAGAALLAGGVAAPAIVRAATGAERRMDLDDAVTLTSGRLDALVAEQHSAFNQGAVLAPFDIATHGAGGDVRLHRLTTSTTVPETGETVKVSGLLAVPAGATGAIPVVSWQHGTLVSFDCVPSNLTLLADPERVMRENVDSAETLFNVHRFASNGFAVVAADYLGKGPFRDGRPEAYAVRDATVRTCIDMLDAGVAGVRALGLEPGPIFLNGWSQGGLNTQWLTQALQAEGRAPRAAAAASPFNDLNEALRFWVGADSYAPPTAAPFPAVPDWVSLAIIILLGSYEAAYGLDGLMQAAVRPEFQALAADFWQRYDLDFGTAPFPSTGTLLVEGFFDGFTSDVGAAFLRRLAENRATYWDYAAPMRLYYGLADEALHPTLAARPLAAGGPRIDGVAVPGASHRATFLASLYGSGAPVGGKPDLLRWFQAALAG